MSAALLFFVEPMFARMILPLLGGAPAVWNTCVVFYQALLFGGYLYAHILSSRLRVRQQWLVHTVLFVVALVMLPLAVGPSSAPPSTANPIEWVFQLLVVGVSLPFFALAATGPLLQRWFGTLGHRASANPYMLYAASNLGSLLALLAYPMLVEPAMRLRTQSIVWTGLYLVLIIIVSVCGYAAAQAVSQSPAPSAQAAEPGAQNPWNLRLRWLTLAAVPSTLMLSVTTFISVDVAAVPLLWMVPLALYLLTFVFAFSDRQLISPRLVARLFPGACVIVVALVLAQNAFPIVTTVAWHLLAFFIVALACHQELAATRPAPERLTEFYLWLSAGGVVGGLFNTLVAPQIFVNPIEYPLAAISACLLLPGAAFAGLSAGRRLLRGASALAPAALLAALMFAVRLLDSRLPQSVAVRYLFIFLIPLLGCYALRRRPLLMGVALAAVLIEGSLVRFDNRIPLYVERTFFGIHKVMSTGEERLLVSGTTNHGAQAVDVNLRCEPLTYYSREGPVGQLFASLAGQPHRTRFGVVGLGTGSIGAYATPGQDWTFFEINPAVEHIARDTRYFTYLRDCAPQASVLIGDARLTLAALPDASFDVLFVDAFSSDAIPVHLLTAEALELYARKLTPSGLLVVHISNRYLQLTPVVAAVARAAGMVGVVQAHAPSRRQLLISAEITASRWAVLARRESDLGTLADNPKWESLAQMPGPVWTDDYSNIAEIFRRRPTSAP